MDDFDPGLKTKDVQAVFATLRKEQVELVRQVMERPQVDTSFLELEYDPKAQWDFGVAVVTCLGYDWKRGRQDESVHPFTCSVGNNDVRITTRVVPRQLTTALFGTIHEGGHALYEQGIDCALYRTPLATNTSLAVHESQSRMLENLVGSSLPFWKFFYPRLQRVFSEQLGGVDLMRFYRGINQVRPSLIRIEADEATYNLHIMLRMELEIALMEGSLAVGDLPEAWNKRMQEYLGLTPPNDALGVLQDVHWSGGSIGYFPTYALGNLISAQLWEKMNTDIPDLDRQFEQGRFEGMLEWLRSRVHSHGAKFESQELVERITGSKISPQPYLRYLKGKYSEIYGL
jgi:carboxypeptidase Taq